MYHHNIKVTSPNENHIPCFSRIVERATKSNYLKNYLRKSVSDKIILVCRYATYCPKTILEKICAPVDVDGLLSSGDWWTILTILTDILFCEVSPGPSQLLKPNSFE